MWAAGGCWLLLALVAAAGGASATSQSPAGECDVYAGAWVHDPATRPLYPAAACRTNRCAKKKGDRSGEYRWQPGGCALPPLEPRRFLTCMRGRRLAFVGDSVSNNFREALLCGLGREGSPTVAGKRTHFAAYNFTVIGHRSNHLVDIAPGRNNNGGVLHLGRPSPQWADQLSEATDAVFTVGPHFSTLSRFSQNGGRTEPPVKPLVAAVGQVAATVARTLDRAGFRGTALFTTHLPSHFKGGSWDKGGRCDMFKTPWDTPPPNSADPDTEPFNAALEAALPGGSSLRLMPVTALSVRRPDSHPGASREFHGGKVRVQDCVHWCLPGAPDTWVELLMHELGCNGPELYEPKPSKGRRS